MKRRMAGFKAGHIKRIKVINFMTYDKEEVFPKSGLNLIIGLNGTGKSSIMCAICLGLGGKPQFTGRATQLSDFIKHGKQEAVIEIELFKRPGKSVTICRTIKNKASTWTLNGKPSNQNEILYITGKLNIDTSNLCQFLPQEKVVEFSKMDKKQRLDNMLKAIGEPQLVELFHNLKDLRGSYCEIEDKIKQIQNKKDENEKRNERLKPEIEKQNEREQLKSRLEVLTLQRKCLEYDACRTKANQKQVFKTECKKKKNTLEKKKDDVLAKRENISAECRQKMKHMKQLVNRLGPLHSKAQKVVQSLNETSANMRRSKIEYKNQIEEKENRKKKIEDLVLQIKGLEECYEKSKSQFESNQELFKVLMQKSSELEAKHSELFQQTEQIKAQANKWSYTILQLEQNLSMKQKERSRELEKLKSISRPAYDATCWLQENKHRFKSNVYTPIMFQIKVKKDEDRKYIENTVAFRDLLAFVCEDKDDAAQLITVLKKEKRLPVNIVMTPDQPLSAFRSPNINSTDKSLGFQAFLSDLFTAPDAVMKYLCRVFNVHRIPVCKHESEQKMEHFLQKFNLFYTPTHRISGRQSKYGERCWSIMKDCVGDKNLLASSEINLEISVLEEQIKAAKQEVDNLRNQYDFLNAQVSDIEKVIEKSRQEKQVLRDQQKEFERTTSILKQKKQLLQTMKSNNLDETTLRLNMENAVKTLATKGQKLVKEQINLLTESLSLEKEEVFTYIELDCTMKILEDVKKEVKEAEDEFKVAKDEYDEAELEHQQALSKARALLKEIQPVLDAETKKLIPGQKSKEAIKTQTNFKSGDESSLPNLPIKQLPRNIDEVDKQIMNVNAQLNLNPEVNKSVLMEYKKHLSEIESALTSIKDCEEQMQNLKEEIDVKKIRWLSPLEVHIENINKKFSQYFKFLKCAGEISLDTCDNTDDFPNYGLQIKLKYREEEPFTELSQTRHSGGECSVAAIIFILSLQELTQVPFRCIDEINQGMDSVNERKIYQLVSDSASTDNCSQYFLLTPKLLMGLSYPNTVCVHTIYSILNTGKRMNVRYHLKQASSLNED